MRLRVSKSQQNQRTLSPRGTVRHMQVYRGCATAMTTLLYSIGILNKNEIPRRPMPATLPVVYDQKACCHKDWLPPLKCELSPIKYPFFAHFKDYRFWSDWTRLTLPCLEPELFFKTHPKNNIKYKQTRDSSTVNIFWRIETKCTMQLYWW